MNPEDFTKLDFNINSMDYLPEGLRPKAPQVSRHSIDRPSPIKRHESVCLLYVLKGTGTVRVNGSSRHVKPGSMLCLYSYHLYTIEPAGEGLEVIRCLCENGTLLFFDLCPYYSGVSLAPDKDTVYLLLEGDDRVQLESCLKRLLAEAEKKDEFSELQSIYLLMEVWGLFQSKSSSNR